LRTSASLYGEDLKTLGEFTVETGQTIPFVLSYLHFKISRRRSIPFRPSTTRKRTGANGAIAVPTSGLGRKR